MRVAFFVGPFPKFSKTFILDQVTGLIDRGVDVHMYASKPKEQSITHEDYYNYNLHSRITYHNIPPIWRRIFELFKVLSSGSTENRKATLRSLDFVKYGERALSLNLCSEIQDFMQKEQYDILHAHFGPLGLVAQRLLNIGVLKGKLVTSFHGNDLSTYLQAQGNQIYNLLFSKGDLFLPVSRYWKEKIIKMGCDEKKTEVHHMGIKCDSFQFSLRSRDDNDFIRLVSVARLTEKKGLKNSIQAFSALFKKNQNIIYRIVGDGPLRDELEELIGKLGLRGKVELIGSKKRDDVIKILNTSDIFIAPSVTASNGDMEGIPMVLMEAMAMGLPVISTNHSGIPELILNGETGFLVPERDVKALSKKIDYLLRHPEILPTVTTNARRFVEHHFNIDKQNDKLLQYYEHLL